VQEPGAVPKTHNLRHRSNGSDVSDVSDAMSRLHPAHGKQKHQRAGSYAPPLLLDSIPLDLENRVRDVHSPAACRDDDQTKSYALHPRHEFFSLDAGALTSLRAPRESCTVRVHCFMKGESNSAPSGINRKPEAGTALSQHQRKINVPAPSAIASALARDINHILFISPKRGWKLIR